MRSDVLLGSGVNTTWPDGSRTSTPVPAAGSARAMSSSTRASPSGSTSLARTSNVVGRPRRVEAMSLWASGGRLSEPSDDRTSTRDGRRRALVAAVGDRVGERDRPGVAGRRRDLHAAAVRVDVDDGVAAGRLDGRDDRTSPFGSVSLARTSTSIGRSTRVWVSSSRAIGGRFGPSSSISSDCTISAFGSSGLTSVMTSPPSSSVLFSSLSSLRSDRMLPQSSTRSRRCRGLVTQAAPESTSFTHTQPLTRRSRSSEPAPSSGTVWTSSHAAVARRAPLGERRPAPWPRRTRTRRGRSAPSARSRGAGRSAVLSPPASGRATRRPSVRGGDDVVGLRPRLLEDELGRLTAGVGDVGPHGRGVVRRRHEDVTVGIDHHGRVRAERRDRDDAVGQLERRAGLGRVVGAQEHDLAGGLVGEDGVAVGRGGGQRRPLATQQWLELVHRRRREELGATDLPHRHRVPVDDEGARRRRRAPSCWRRR